MSPYTVPVTGLKQGDIVKVDLKSNEVKLGQADKLLTTEADTSGGGEVVYVTVVKTTGTATTGYYVSDDSDSNAVPVTGLKADDIVLIDAESELIAVGQDGKLVADETGADAAGKVYAVQVYQKASGSTAKSGCYVSKADPYDVDVAGLKAGDIIDLVGLATPAGYLVGASNKITTTYNDGDLVYVEEIVTSGTTNNGFKLVDSSKQVPGANDVKYIVSRVAEKDKFKKF